MDSKTVMKSLICNEQNDSFFNDWFKCKSKAFISHVDTFYFVVYPDVQDWKTDERKLAIMDLLRNKKASADSERISQEIFTEFFQGLEVQPYFGFQMYSYHFGLKDNFDVFVCENVPNLNTPPVFVQIRSQSLWLNGLKKSFDIACDCIEKIFTAYGINIKKIVENRIDYAFHTNYIQDFSNFFPERNLKEMQISNFSRWHKEGYFYEEEIFSDYFTLGRRKSNNVFFRTYNKTKEVIEMGYKQFFIPIWLDNGLISKFDEYVLKRAFVYGSYASKDKARCEFYYDYGKDYSLRKEIYDKLQNPDTPITWFTNTAKCLVPDITLVCNVEFQTKRKFYDRLTIPFVVEEQTYKSNIYNLFEQLSCLIDMLTHETIRFVKYKGKFKSVPRLERPYADWWSRLRSSKPLEYKTEWIIDYFREYQKNLDIERQKLTSINKMARYSAYNLFENDSCTTLITDIYDFLGSLNDNDMVKYYNVRDSKIKELKNRDKLVENETQGT